MPAAAKKPKAIRSIEIDLFVGCGGLVLGFEQAGFDIVASVGIDPIHSAVHEHNFPYSTTICANVKNLSGTDIRGIPSRKITSAFPELKKR